MPAKKADEPPPRLVRKSLMIDAEKLTRAQKVLGARSEAEVLRLALDHLLEHFPEGHTEEE
jgi:hypothetical protein